MSCRVNRSSRLNSSHRLAVRNRLEGWSSWQARGVDGTFESVQRARSARPAVEMSDKGARMLGRRYWREVVRAGRGFVHCRQEPEGVELRLLRHGPVLLGFRSADTSFAHDRVSCSYAISGGLLTRRVGGTLILSQIGGEEVELRTTVTGFAPRLGVTLGFVQRRVHAAVSRRYFARLIAEANV
jgi:hypothetical protein